MQSTLLVLNLSLDIINRVSGLDFQGDGLAGEGLDKDLHFLWQVSGTVLGERKERGEGSVLPQLVAGRMDSRWLGR